LALIFSFLFLKLIKYELKATAILLPFDTGFWGTPPLRSKVLYTTKYFTVQSSLIIDK